MVKGLDIFRERFHTYRECFVLIGGAACDEWFGLQGLKFRATRDLDIVILVEVLDPLFVAAMRDFIDEGGYRVRKRTDGSPVLYRFDDPADGRFPSMIELFSRSMEGFESAVSREIIPVEIEPGKHSLSAILLDSEYYSLIRTLFHIREGLRFATSSALIPLKARAWLDLRARRSRGEHVDSRDIDKHRNDVFRLAGTLPGVPGPWLPASIAADLSLFLAAFPTESLEWPGIMDSLRTVFGSGVHPTILLDAVRIYFRLPVHEPVPQIYYR